MNDIEQIFDDIDQYADNIDDLVKALKGVGIKDFEQFKAAAREAGAPVKKSIQDKVAEKFANSEEEDWQTALASDTEEAYLQYLRLYPIGQYREDAREKIKSLQTDSENKKSSEEWKTVDKESIEDIRLFINSYPNSTHISEAKSILRELQRERIIIVDIPALKKQINAIMADSSIVRKDDAIYDKLVKYIKTGKITVDDLIMAIKEDHNFISGNVAYKLWDNGDIEDFSEASIHQDFIKHMMSGVTPAELDGAKSLDRITKVPCTEVYFWGIPSSGKSCAIGAILSAANNGSAAMSMLKDPKCQGYGYMNDLSDLFGLDNEVGTLPERTKATLGTTYEMGFELQDIDGYIHPITCVDIAGEVFCDMHKLQAKGADTLKTDVQDVLKTLNNILIDNRTANRKIHFFVIEYGAEDRKYKGVPQGTYLQSAVAYINETGIFKKDTDAVYILVTKVDKAKAVGNELKSKLKEYISKNYLGFYNGLKRICVDNEINRGDVVIQPFTLGDVCFQYYCRFNEKAASDVVKAILTRSYRYKPGKLQKLINKLKS